MSLKIKSIGGYNEFGKNMTLLDIDGKLIILDMGFAMEEYVLYSESHSFNESAPDIKELVQLKIIPDIFQFKDKWDDVIAIIPSHSHLDHIGAIKYLLKYFKNAKLYATPYTSKVIESDYYFSKLKIPEINTKKHGNIFKLSKGINGEFIYVTHSTPDSSLVCIHTPYGKVIYTDDFKIDREPVLGPETDIKRLKELNDVTALIMDSTNAPFPGRTKTELQVKKEMEELFHEINNSHEKIIITTFSSQISRLKTIKECSEEIGRIPLYIGRSLARYIYAAHDTKLTNLGNQDQIAMYPNKIRQFVKLVNANPKKYVLVTTGHQGEVGANLRKIVDGILKLKISDKDYVIFSSKTIPSKSSIANMKVLEDKLSKTGINIIKNLHASGHASREEILELIDLVKPKNLIPNNADEPFCREVERMAIKNGFDKKKIFVLNNFEELEFK